MKIASMGVKDVHPLDGMDQKQSIKSTKSILSILIAPALHQICIKINHQPNWIGGSISFIFLLFFAGKKVKKIGVLTPISENQTPLLTCFLLG
jgi:hypothetical protein